MSANGRHRSVASNVYDRGCYNRASKLLAPRLVLTLVVERVTFFPDATSPNAFRTHVQRRLQDKFEIFELPLIHRKGKVTASLTTSNTGEFGPGTGAEQASDKFQPSQSYALPKIESLYLEIDWILQDVIVTDLREDREISAYRPEYWNSSGNRLCSKRNILLREGLSGTAVHLGAAFDRQGTPAVYYCDLLLA